jgi:hypothetical protein
MALGIFLSSLKRFLWHSMQNGAEQREAGGRPTVRELSQALGKGLQWNWAADMGVERHERTQPPEIVRDQTG